MPNKTELKKREAISLILCGKTDAEVAETIGVSRQTIWKWKQHEEFNHDIVETGERVLEQHTLAVSKLVDEAISAMSELLKSDDESMKFKAATTVLNAASNWKERRPTTPGHVRAENEIDEEQVNAILHFERRKQQFKEQGGKPDDLMRWLLEGGSEDNGNGTESTNSNESEKSEAK